MVKIEKNYKSISIFNEDKSTTWDRDRHKTFKVKFFGLTIFDRTEDLTINYEDTETKKTVGFKNK